MAATDSRVPPVGVGQASRARPHASAPMTVPILVISLTRSTHRREYMSKQLDRLGLPWEFIDAIDGVNGGAHRLTPGEVGCARSHLRCYELIIERGLDAALILEDDVALPSNLGDTLRALSQTPAEWELVLLAHHSTRHGPRVGAESMWRRVPLDVSHALARPVEFAMGAMAYVIRRSAAHKLLRYGSPLRMPADWLTGFAPSAGVRAYLVTPPIAWPDEETSVPTTIPGREGSAAPLASPTRRQRLRTCAGDVWLLARKMGIAPNAFSRRF